MESRKSLTDLYEQVRAGGEPRENLEAIRLAILELRQHRARKAARRARLFRHILLGGGIALTLGGMAVISGAFGPLRPEPRAAAPRSATVAKPGRVGVGNPTAGWEDDRRLTPSGDRPEAIDRGPVAARSFPLGLAATPGPAMRVSDGPAAADRPGAAGGPAPASSSEAFQRDQPVAAVGRLATSPGTGRPSAVEPARSVADPRPGAPASEPVRGSPKLSALPPIPAAPRQDRPDPATAASPVVNQLEAFKRGDHGGAYRYASGEIKRRFGLAAFTRMVETSYPEIASYRRVEMGRTEMQPDGTVHVHLTIHGGAGPTVAALYEMVWEEGAWKVNKVITTASPDPAS